MALSKYSKNQDAAWIFMQWACSKDVMAPVCTLVGGFARCASPPSPIRASRRRPRSAPARRAILGVKWTIDNVMGSEPDMPLWAGLSNNEIPAELGKLLTGQY